MFKLLIKHYIYTGASICAVWFCWVMWPSMPRASYLAQGCSTTTTGAVADVFGGIFSALARLFTLVAGFSIGAGAVALVGLLVSAGVYTFKYIRDASRNRVKTPKTPKPKKIKPVIVDGSRYMNYFPHTGPGLLTRLWLRWHRKYMSTDIGVFSVLMWTCGVLYAGLAFAATPYVCMETTAQKAAFWSVILTLLAVSVFLSTYVWLQIRPRDRACAKRDRVYGDLHAFWENELRLEHAVAFQVYYLWNGPYRNGGIFHTLDKKAVAFAVQAVPGNAVEVATLYVDREHDELTVHVRLGADVRYAARLDGSRLIVGRTDHNYAVTSGMRLYIDTTTSIEHFLCGVFTMFKDMIEMDGEAQAVIRESAERARQPHLQVQSKPAFKPKPKRRS